MVIPARLDDWCRSPLKDLNEIGASVEPNDTATTRSVSMNGARSSAAERGRHRLPIAGWLVQGGHGCLIALGDPLAVAFAE